MLGEVVKKLEKRSIKKESLERILDEYILHAELSKTIANIDLATPFSV